MNQKAEFVVFCHKCQRYDPCQATLHNEQVVSGSRSCGCPLNLTQAQRSFECQQKSTKQLFVHAHDQRLFTSSPL